jgi:hypothetical protein
VSQFFAANAKSRERIRNLISDSSDEELKLVINVEGWTVAVALAHVAFWDERRLVLVRKWKKEAVAASPVDVDVVNDALIPFFSAICPRKAADMALQMAEALDNEFEKASPSLILAMGALGDQHALDRSIHRNMHLAEIEALLKAKRALRK